MKKKNYHALNNDSSIVLPNYNIHGRLMSVVVEKGVFRKVPLRPTTLMDYSLRCYGSSLRGALEGTKMLLGKISLLPIVMSIQPNTYWFPSSSPTRNDCVWFRFCHVKDYDIYNKSQTKVLMQDNCEVVLDASYYSFNERINRANKLKYLVEKQFNPTIIYEHKVPYIIRKKNKELNYRTFEDASGD